MEQSLSDQIKQLIEEIKVYVNLRISYFRVHVAEFLIRFFSGLVLWGVIFLFLFFMLVFGSFPFAHWFGSITGNLALGYLIVAGVYILLALLIYSFRRPLIVRPFTKMIMEQMDLDQLIEKEDGKEEK
jgi:hypothetical protein